MALAQELTSGTGVPVNSINAGGQLLTVTLKEK